MVNIYKNMVNNGYNCVIALYASRKANPDHNLNIRTRTVIASDGDVTLSKQKMASVR